MSLGPRIDSQTITTYATRAQAQAIADANAAADDVGDVVYVVESNARGFFVAMNDAADGVRIGTL